MNRLRNKSSLMLMMMNPLRVMNKVKFCPLQNPNTTKMFHQLDLVVNLIVMAVCKFFKEHMMNPLLKHVVRKRKQSNVAISKKSRLSYSMKLFQPLIARGSHYALLMTPTCQRNKDLPKTMHQ